MFYLILKTEALYQTGSTCNMTPSISYQRYNRPEISEKRILKKCYRLHTDTSASILSQYIGLSHPESYLFSLSKKIFFRIKVSKKRFFNFEIRSPAGHPQVVEILLQAMLQNRSSLKIQTCMESVTSWLHLNVRTLIGAPIFKI